MKRLISVILSAALITTCVSSVSATVTGSRGGVNGSCSANRTYGSASTTGLGNLASLDLYRQNVGGGGDVFQQSASGSPSISINVRSGYVVHRSYSTHGNGAGTTFNLVEYNKNYL